MVMKVRVKTLFLFLVVSILASTLVIASTSGIHNIRNQIEKTYKDGKGGYRFDLEELGNKQIGLDVSDLRVYHVLSYETMPPKESFVLERDGEVYYGDADGSGDGSSRTENYLSDNGAFPYKDDQEQALIYIATADADLFHTRKILRSASDIPSVSSVSSTMASTTSTSQTGANAAENPKDSAAWHSEYSEITAPAKKGNKIAAYTWSEVNGILTKWTITSKKGHVSKVAWEVLAVGVGNAEMDWERGGPAPGEKSEKTINTLEPLEPNTDLYPSQNITVNDSYIDVLWTETGTTVQPIQVNISGFDPSTQVEISVVLFSLPPNGMSSTIAQTINATNITTDGSGRYVWNFTAPSDTHTGVGDIRAVQTNTPSKNASLYSTKSGTNSCSSYTSDCYLIIEKIAQRNSTDDNFMCKAYYFSASASWNSTRADEFANDSAYACANAYDIDISSWNFTSPDPDSTFQVFITDGSNTASAWFEPRAPHNAPQDVPSNAHSHSGEDGQFCTRLDLNDIIETYGWQFETERLMQYDVIEHEFYHNVQYGANAWEGGYTNLEGLARNSESIAYPNASTWVNGALKTSTITQHNSYLSNPDRALSAFSYTYALPWGYIYQHNGMAVLRNLEYNLTSYSAISYDTGLPDILNPVLADLPGDHDSFEEAIGGLGVAIYTNNLTWGDVDGNNQQNWSSYDDNVTKTSPTWSSGSAIVSGTVYRWALDFINVSNTAYTSITVSFDGEDDTYFSVDLATRNGTNYTVQHMSLNSNNAGALVLSNPSAYDAGALIVARNTSSGDSTASYIVTLLGNTAGDNIAVTGSSYEPSIVSTGGTINVTATIWNIGSNNENNIEVRLLQNGTQYANTSIASLNAGESTTVSFNWSNSTTAGAYNLTVYAVPVSGESATSDNQISTTITATSSRIILVDDDDSDSYETYFASALAANSYSYVNWSTDVSGAPSNTVLNQFQIVIWFTGQEYINTLTSNEQTILQTYLDTNKSLFISGQEIGYQAGDTDFYTNYLKAVYEDDDSGINTVVGVTNDPITNGMTLGLSGSGGANDNDYPDEISPNTGAGATGIFNYSGDGGAGLRYNSSYQLVYLSFNFEAINVSSNRTTLMKNIIEWLDVVGPTNLSIAINNGASTTNTTAVGLSLNASDATSLLCHYSNNGTIYTSYEAYTNTKSWDLTSGSGNKTVYYQCKDGHGTESQVVNATIRLVEAPTNLSVSINSGAGYTNTTSVTLTLYADNASECAYSNDSSTYSDWEAYSTAKNWSLPSTDGTKYVYYKCRNTDNTTSSAVNDSIVLDTAAPSGIYLSSPALSNNSFTNKSWVYVNITFTETNPDSCWVQWNNGTSTNISMTRSGTSCYKNITGQVEGAWNYTIYVNDSAGNRGSNGTFYITIDTTLPTITNISNQTISYSSSSGLGAQFNATDINGISGWSVNDSANFTINSTGYLRNATRLSVRVYSINISVNDSVGNVASQNIWVNVTSAPTINSYSTTPQLVINGSEVKFYINATNASMLWATVTLPDATTENVTLTNNTNTTYTSTTLVGRYNVTFYANGSTADALTNSTTYFESAIQVTFNASVISANSSGLNSTFTAYYRDTTLVNASAPGGDYSEALPNGLVDLEFAAYTDHIKVRLRSVNLSTESGESFGMYNVSTPATGYLVTYGINNTYNFTNATVSISYNGTGYASENDLEFYKCSNWSFNDSSCLGNWTDITSNSTMDTTTKYFSYVTTSFSGFSVMQGDYCGDGTCDADETCTSCESDCGACSTGGNTGNTGGTSGRSGTGGGGGGGGGGSGGSSNAKRNATILHEAAVAEPACTEDSGCPDNAACLGGKCWPMTGTCGFAANHTWKYYECCSDSMCSKDQTCKNHSCIGIRTTQSTSDNGTEQSRGNETECLDGDWSGNGDGNGSWDDNCTPLGGGNGKLVNLVYTLLWPMVGSIAVLLIVGVLVWIVLRKKQKPKVGIVGIGNSTKTYRRKGNKNKNDSNKQTFGFAGLIGFGFAGILLLLLVVQLANAAGEKYNHPLHSSSYIDANHNTTTYKFKIINRYNTSTVAFQLWLTSSFSWFNPKTFTYAWTPDGFSENAPYWDIPPIEPNESIEVSFAVNGTRGLAESIKVGTAEIDKWKGEQCGDLAPVGTVKSNASTSSTGKSTNSTTKSKGYTGYSEHADKIAQYLNSLNRSQNVTVYYEKRGKGGEFDVLAHLKEYNIFAVFEIASNNSNGTSNATSTTRVSFIDSKARIVSLVTNYTNDINATVSRQKSQNHTSPEINVSKPYQSLLESIALKEAPERDCYKITGMARFPCIDRPSCLYACFSVPVCSDLGQSGWSFMDTIQSYNESVYKTNALFESVLFKTLVFSEHPDYENAKNALNGMVELNKAETTVIFHPLFTSYGFCQPPEYGMPQQTDARREILNYLEENCIYGEKERIVNESILAAAKLGPPLSASGLSPLASTQTASIPTSAKYSTTNVTYTASSGTDAANAIHNSTGPDEYMQSNGSDTQGNQNSGESQGNDLMGFDRTISVLVVLAALVIGAWFAARAWGGLRKGKNSSGSTPRAMAQQPKPKRAWTRKKKPLKPEYQASGPIDLAEPPDSAQ